MGAGKGSTPLTYVRWAWTQPVPLHCSWALYRRTVPGYTGLGARQELTCAEDTEMHLQRPWWSGLITAVLGGLVGVTAVAAASEQFLPMLSTREGVQRFVMIPRADGYIAYLTLLNERDGGINGVKLIWEECETVHHAPRGGEGNERL